MRIKVIVWVACDGELGEMYLQLQPSQILSVAAGRDPHLGQLVMPLTAFRVSKANYLVSWVPKSWSRRDADVGKHSGTPDPVPLAVAAAPQKADVSRRPHVEGLQWAATRRIESKSGRQGELGTGPC